jgi:Xaa-Pro aminopeptidase
MDAAPAHLRLARHAKLRDLMRAAGLDGLLITSLPNVAYLTGLFASAAGVVITRDRIALITDGRYLAIARDLVADLPGVDLVITPASKPFDLAFAEALCSIVNGRAGFEAAHLTVKRHQDLKTRLGSMAPGCGLESTEGLVEGLRILKDEWELAVMTEAAGRLSDAAKCIIPKALAGLPERDLAAIIEWELRQKGFDKPAFDTIVASGPNAAIPHHRAGDRHLAAGDLVVIDFGGLFRGYAVDMTRTVILGQPSRRQQACWDAVARAQRAAFHAATVGTDAEDVDAAARRVLEQEGLAEAFGHGLGHGLGLDVHERPRLSRRRAGVSLGPLQAGMVFTLEPGVYFPGWGGVRIEDDVLATAAGPEWLTEPVDMVRAS